MLLRLFAQMMVHLRLKENNLKKICSESEIANASELWQQSLLCTLESRYLLRYLVDNLTSQPTEKRDAVLTAVKEKARSQVLELLSAND